MIIQPDTNQEVTLYNRNDYSQRDHDFDNFGISYKTIQEGVFNIPVVNTTIGEYTFTWDLTLLTLTITSSSPLVDLQKSSCVYNLLLSKGTNTLAFLVESDTQVEDTRIIKYDIVLFGDIADLLGLVWAIEVEFPPVVDPRTICLTKISSMKIEQLATSSATSATRGTATVQETSLATFTPSITPAGVMSTTVLGSTIACYFTGNMTGVDAVFDGLSLYNFKAGLFYSAEYTGASSSQEFSPDNGTQRFYENTASAGDKNFFKEFDKMNFGVSQSLYCDSTFSRSSNTVEETVINNWRYGGGKTPSINILSWAEYGGSSHGGITAEEISSMSEATKYFDFTLGYGAGTDVSVNGSQCCSSGVRAYAPDSTRWNTIPPITNEVNFAQYCLNTEFFSGYAKFYLKDGTPAQELIGVVSYTTSFYAGYYRDDFVFDTAIIPDASKCYIMATSTNSGSSGAGRYMINSSSSISMQTGDKAFGGDPSYGSAYFASSVSDPPLYVIFQNHDNLGNLLP